MRLTRLFLRNYRVYEDALELEIPAGLVGIYGVNGAGKCLPAGTRVWDGETGEGLPIERFVTEHRKWMLGFHEGRVQPVQVSDWLDLGPKPTVVVRLASGAEIEVATTHPLLTDHGCVRAEELRPGDWVAEVRALPETSRPFVTNDEALLLGMLLGDGSLTQRPVLSALDPDVVAAFRGAVERTFPGCTVRSCFGNNHMVVSKYGAAELVEIRRRLATRLLDEGVPLRAYAGKNIGRFVRGDASLSWENLLRIEQEHGLDLHEERCSIHGGRAMVELVRSFGLDRHDFRSKRVPPSLLLMPDEQVAHLLAGLWLRDGYVRAPRTVNGRRQSGEVSYTTGSPGLADDVRVLLLRLGMTSYRRTRTVRHNTFHTVTLTAAAWEGLGRIPLVGVTAERAKEVLAYRATAQPHPAVDLIPPSFSNGSRRTSASGRYRSNEQRATHAMSREVFRDFGGDERVADAETMWSMVVSVVPTGRAIPCFDVSVETPEHLYLAETFIVHNSYLCESVRFALWGKARTGNDDVRTTGVNGDCIVEVEFEHEGHLYVVRRTLTGINSTMKAEAHANGAQVAEGARDVGRYVQSILGMDDAAFRASVFAEQKQIAAFSNQTPAKRRELVLRLLGITPLDLARDEARRDAKAARDDHDRLRGLLPPLDDLREALRTADDVAAAARRVCAEATATEGEAKERAVAAEAALEALDELRRTYDDLVADGKAVKAQHEAAERRVHELTAEQADLADAGDRLAALQPEVEGLAAAEARLAHLDVAAKAEAALAALPPATDVPEPDEAGAEAARLSAEQAGAVVADLNGELRSAKAEGERAREAASRSASLSGEGDCPLCGQALGDAFEQVQAHRAAEVTEADARVTALEKELAAATKAATAATKAAKAAAAALADARTAWSAAEQARAHRALAEQALAEALEALGAPPAPGEGDALRAEVARRRAAADECRRLEGKLDRRAAVERQLDDARSAVLDLKGRLDALRDKVKSLGFQPDAHAAARAERTAARETAEAAARRASEARVAEERTRTAAEAAAKALADAEAQHARIADLADTSRHLGRLAELLNAFRTNVVAAIGPRLATEAAELFAELTDHEYDRLEVDPETWEIQVRDAGRVHGMDRFSGSETDLANLALRVAISEHVRFQSGGAVGLLVLDEVFGPLDDDRRERMLQALDHLRNRFRQILVVTHANDVKEQLPSAIEVVKLPGRRATARVIAGV